MAIDWKSVLSEGWDLAKDWFSSDSSKNLIERLILGNPNMSIEDILKLAEQQNQMTSPNIYTPFGGATTTFDPETGQPTVSQHLPEGVLNLVNAIGQRTAGGEINSFQTPGAALNMGEANLNRMERARNMPESQVDWWQKPDAQAVPWTDLVNPSGAPTGGSGSPSPGGGLPSEGSDPGIISPGGGGGLVPGSPAIPGDDIIDTGPGFDLPTTIDGINLDPIAAGQLQDAIDAYVNTQEPGKFGQWVLENMPFLGDVAGTLTDILLGIPGLGSLIESWIEKYGKEYWMNNEWASDVENYEEPPSELDEQIEDWLEFKEPPSSGGGGGGGFGGGGFGFGSGIWGSYLPRKYKTGVVPNRPEDK